MIYETVRTVIFLAWCAAVVAKLTDADVARRHVRLTNAVIAVGFIDFSIDAALDIPKALISSNWWWACAEFAWLAAAAIWFAHLTRKSAMAGAR